MFGEEKKQLEIASSVFSSQSWQASAEQTRRLLGAILHQAMYDRMTSVSLGVDNKGQTPRLRYFGPDHYELERRAWWDMCPFPPEWYPTALQACFVLAQMEPRLPLVGTIPSVCQGTRLGIAFQMEDLYSFELSWTVPPLLRVEGPRPVIDIWGWDEESDKAPKSVQAE